MPYKRLFFHNIKYKFETRKCSRQELHLPSSQLSLRQLNTTVDTTVTVALMVVVSHLSVVTPRAVTVKVTDPVVTVVITSATTVAMVAMESNPASDMARATVVMVDSKPA